MEGFWYSGEAPLGWEGERMDDGDWRNTNLKFMLTSLSRRRRIEKIDCENLQVFDCISGGAELKTSFGQHSGFESFWEAMLTIFAV